MRLTIFRPMGLLHLTLAAAVTISSATETNAGTRGLVSGVAHRSTAVIARSNTGTEALVNHSVAKIAQRASLAVQHSSAAVAVTSDAVVAYRMWPFDQLWTTEPVKDEAEEGNATQGYQVPPAQVDDKESSPKDHQDRIKHRMRRLRRRVEKYNVQAGGKKESPGAVPYPNTGAFGRESKAEDLTMNSVRESNGMIDQIEQAQTVEGKRAVYRALTHLRGLTVATYDGIAKGHMKNIDEYNSKHQWRKEHKIRHLAKEEADVKKWAFKNGPGGGRRRHIPVLYHAPPAAAPPANPGVPGPAAATGNAAPPSLDEVPLADLQK